MEELDMDYDITCDNLVDIDQEVVGFKVYEGEFYDMKLKDYVSIKTLKNGDDKTIFKTKDDGRYVLEVEDLQMGTVEYFYSFNIQDLV